MFLRLVVNVPKRVSLKGRRILKELAEELGESERPSPEEFEGDIRD